MSAMPSVTILLLSTALLGSSAASAPVSVVAIQAMPYYPSTGNIRRSTDLFDRRLALRNVVITPSDGVDPLHRDRIADWDIPFGTTVTYIEAELDSKELDPTKFPRDLRIEMQATSLNTRHAVGKQVIVASSVAPSGIRRWRIPFVLYGTGCEPLRISVRVTYREKSLSSLSNTIPFSCRE